MAAAMRWMVVSSKVGSGDWDIRTTGAGLGARVAAGFRLGRAAAPGPTCAHTGADTAMAAPSAATMIDFRMGSPSWREGTRSVWRYLDRLIPPPRSGGGSASEASRGGGPSLLCRAISKNPPPDPPRYARIADALRRRS